MAGSGRYLCHDTGAGEELTMTKVDCSQIVPGVKFSKPVFFDDGQNMFLCANHPAKNYHVAAIKRWAIPYLLTEGVLVSASDSTRDKAEEIEELVELEEF